MAQFLRMVIFTLFALTISTAVFAAPSPTQATMATIQTKVFTRDQLASALDTVVNNINRCEGNTACLKGVKEWNNAAMSQVKGAAKDYSNTKLSLSIMCGKNISSQTVTTDANGKFTLPSTGKTCLIRGIKPKCGALAKGKKYPEAKNGATLYCVTGSDTKLKATTKNLKTAIIAAMKKAVMDKMKENSGKTTPTPSQQPTQ